MRSRAPTSVVLGTTDRDWRTLTTAWTGTLVLSRLPEIVLVEAMGFDSAPMPWLWLGSAGLLVVLAAVWRPARPLRNYFTVMVVVIAVAFFLRPLATDWLGVETGSDLVREFSDKTVFLVLALGVAGFLIVALRLTPEAAFITVGNLRAPSTIRLPGAKQPLSWAILGPTAAGLLVVGFAGQMWLGSTVGADILPRLLPMAVLVVFTAAFNAFGEEVVFRSGPLACLHQVVGSSHAVLMTSVWFGLGHYYGGIPSGPLGAMQSGVLALLLGQAMVDTKGLGWPWIIHFAIDVVVFASVAAA